MGTFEQNFEKFTHLGKMPPEVTRITNLNPHDVDSDHLGFLDEHLEGLQNQFPSIAKDITKTRKKIRIAMGLEFNVSGEVMEAANNREYRSLHAA